MTSSIYQMEGFDDDGRYFSRAVILTESGGIVSVSFNYEGLMILANSHPSRDEALKELVSELKKRGFKKIRARLNYIGDRYLAEGRPWIYFRD